MSTSEKYLYFNINDSDGLKKALFPTKNVDDIETAVLRAYEDFFNDVLSQIKVENSNDNLSIESLNLIYSKDGVSILKSDFIKGDKVINRAIYSEKKISEKGFYSLLLLFFYNAKLDFYFKQDYSKNNIKAFFRIFKASHSLSDKAILNKLEKLRLFISEVPKFGILKDIYFEISDDFSIYFEDASQKQSHSIDIKEENKEENSINISKETIIPAGASVTINNNIAIENKQQQKQKNFFNYLKDVPKQVKRAGGGLFFILFTSGLYYNYGYKTAHLEDSKQVIENPTFICNDSAVKQLSEIETSKELNEKITSKAIEINFNNVDTIGKVININESSNFTIE